MSINSSQLNDKTIRPITFTETEQREKLIGYVVVHRDYWPFIKYSTHIRYTTTAEKGGKFRSGGFVLNNPFDTKVYGGPNEKRFIKLQNGFNKSGKDYKTWIVAYEDIEYLYAKGAGVELTIQHDLRTAVATLNKNITHLAEYFKKLDRRIAEIERRI